MRRKLPLASAGTAVAVAATLFLTAPGELRHRPSAPDLGGDLDAWLESAEREAAGTAPLVAGAEKRIRWFEGRRGSRSVHAVVYLHGFSATRQEIAPVAEMVAEGLGANLFETRLAGHGRQSRALAGVRAEDWLDDAVEALAVGARIGERLVVIGTSTGATLALAASEVDAFEAVDALVLISPNFAPRNADAELLLRPGGPQIARLTVGATRSWTPANDEQARYWSTSYPTAALVEMMRLVAHLRAKLPLELEQPLLTLYSPEDRVVDVERIESSLDAIHSPRKRTVPIAETADPGRHVLAGDILAPENNRLVADLIIRFVRDARL